MQEFYEKVAVSRFLISPHGDRPDCYRHWEAIGLAAFCLFGSIDKGSLISA